MVVDSLILRAESNTRLERPRHERASLLSCAGVPLKRNVRWLRNEHEEDPVFHFRLSAHIS